MIGERIALVTGASGFLGSNLVRRLVDEGTIVWAVDVRHPPEWMHDHRQVWFERMDLTKAGALDAVWARRQITEVWHMASWASPRRYKARPVETLRLGGQVLDELLTLAVGWNARLLFASSSEVYGDPELHPQSEDYRGNVSTTGPRSMYDESKRYGEAMCAAYQRAGVDTRIARIFNTYGPGMDRDDGRLVPELLLASIRGEPFEIHGTGNQTRTLCYVDDLLDGLFTLMRAPPSPRTREPVNVGGSEELSIHEIVQRAREATQRSIETTSAPKQDEHDPMARRPDLRRIQALGWKGPQVSVVDGLRLTAEWFRGVDPLQQVDEIG